MRLLALDTATLRASVAVVAGTPGEVPEVTVLAAAAAAVTTHSEMLLGLVAATLTRAGLGVADLEVVGCGAGPGSFTGLRIGLCTAKGLCFARGRPLVMASSLRAVALAAAPEAQANELVVAVLDAKKGEVYGGFYRGARAVPAAPEVALPPADFARHVAATAAGAPLLLCGAGVAAYAGIIPPALPQARLTARLATPGAVEVARLCFERLARGETEDLARAVPTYLRPSEAERTPVRG